KSIPDPRLAAGNVAYTYAGVRPLTWEDNARASDVSRAHKVIGEEDGRFLSITGTKLTCFRSLAAQLGDHVLDTLDLRARSRTAELTLDGADEAVGRTEAHAWLDDSPETATTGLSRDTLETLVTTYGRGYHRVIEMAGKVAGGGERLCPVNPDIVAQLHLAVQDELAVSLQDVLLRRTGIGTSACQGLASAETEVTVWHAMGGALGEKVKEITDAFNKTQSEYKVTPVYKGNYTETMTAAIAAFRARQQPHVVQVFEVGTATMMSARGAIKPVHALMAEAGERFDPSAYLPAVTGYYTSADGKMLSLPFNSSTPVLYFNKDAFKKAGLDPAKAPATWPELGDAGKKLQAAGLPCGFTTDWQSWI